MNETLLSVENLFVSYGGIQALQGISFSVSVGEVVSLIGANGAGKSTTLRAISRIVKAKSGSVTYNGADLLAMRPEEVVRRGIAQSPEGRRVLTRLSIQDNLELGAYVRKDKAAIVADIDEQFALFPRLKERDQQVAGGLRKVVRLMKSVKYDSGNVALSSYDLAAIGYVMPEHQLLTSPGEELALLSRLQAFLDLLAANDDFRAEMLVPDESRHIFVDGHATLAGLNELRGEISDLVEAICCNRQKSFHRLAEARVAY